MAQTDSARAPEPFDHLIASPVFSPDWGRGWLGYEIVGDTTDMWFVPDDLSGSVEVEFTDILGFNDKKKSQLWIIFVNSPTDEARAFLLHPSEDGVLFPVPAKVRKILEA